VFFWATRERLITLLNARAYRGTRHDVLTINTASFVEEYKAEIMLCHMNSGNAFPIPHRRDYSIFKSVQEYPVNHLGNPIKEVAEVTVNYAVKNVAKHTIRVERMIGSTVEGLIFQA